MIVPPVNHLIIEKGGERLRGCDSEACISSQLGSIAPMSYYLRPSPSSGTKINHIVTFCIMYGPTGVRSIVGTRRVGVDELRTFIRYCGTICLSYCSNVHFLTDVQLSSTLRKEGISESASFAGCMRTVCTLMPADRRCLGSMVCTSGHPLSQPSQRINEVLVMTICDFRQCSSWAECGRLHYLI